MIMYAASAFAVITPVLAVAALAASLAALARLAAALPGPPPVAVPAFCGSQHCVIVAVDIAGSAGAGRDDDEVQLELRDALYGLLVRAFAASAIPWDQCLHEDRGDGILVIVPARLPTVTVINPLLAHLQALVRRHNRLAREPAQIRLRVAVHIGEVHRDQHGLAGVAVNHVFRLLDAPVLKQALASRCAELVLIVSDYVYDSVVRHSRAMIDPAAFQPVTASVKETRTRAWTLLPDQGLPPLAAEFRAELVRD
jgi:hypothetical protein